MTGASGDPVEPNIRLLLRLLEARVPRITSLLPPGGEERGPSPAGRANDLTLAFDPELGPLYVKQPRLARAYYFRAIEGLTDRQIARRLRVARRCVRADIEAARAWLRDWHRISLSEPQNGAGTG